MRIPFAPRPAHLPGPPLCVPLRGTWRWGAPAVPRETSAQTGNRMQGEASPARGSGPSVPPLPHVRGAHSRRGLHKASPRPSPLQLLSSGLSPLPCCPLPAHGPLGSHLRLPSLSPCPSPGRAVTQGGDGFPCLLAQRPSVRAQGGGVGEKCGSVVTVEGPALGGQGRVGRTMLDAGIGRGLRRVGQEVGCSAPR